jgi:hypothetical protein
MKATWEMSEPFDNWCRVSMVANADTCSTRCQREDWGEMRLLDEGPDGAWLKAWNHTPSCNEWVTEIWHCHCYLPVHLQSMMGSNTREVQRENFALCKHGLRVRNSWRTNIVSLRAIQVEKTFRECWGWHQCKMLLEICSGLWEYGCLQSSLHKRQQCMEHCCQKGH